MNINIRLSKLSKIKETFLKRKLKSKNEWEDNIISDDVRYICYSKCIGCCKVIDIGKLCSNFSLMQIRNKNGIDMFRCINKSKEGKTCDYYNFLKIRFRYGNELFNQIDKNFYL